MISVDLFSLVCYTFLLGRYTISITCIMWDDPTNAAWVNPPPPCMKYPNMLRSETAAAPPDIWTVQMRGSVSHSGLSRPQPSRQHVFPGHAAPVGRGHHLCRHRGFRGGAEDFPLNPGAKLQDLLQHRLPASPGKGSGGCWEGIAPHRSRETCLLFGKKTDLKKNKKMNERRNISGDRDVTAIEKKEEVGFYVSLCLSRKDCVFFSQAFDSSICKDEHLAVAFFQRGLTFYKMQRSKIKICLISSILKTNQIILNLLTAHIRR